MYYFHFIIEISLYTFNAFKETNKNIASLFVFFCNFAFKMNKNVEQKERKKNWIKRNIGVIILLILLSSLIQLLQSYFILLKVLTGKDLSILTLVFFTVVHCSSCFCRF